VGHVHRGSWPAFDRDSIAPTPFALIEGEAEDVTREDGRRRTPKRP